MSSDRMGPELPPHLLAKRKRKAEVSAALDAQPADTTEVEPLAKAPTADQIHGPMDTTTKRARVLGPAAPPAPLDERPPGSPNDPESSDDDEFGPSLPGQNASDTTSSVFDAIEATPDASNEPAPSRRDDWMTMPPKQDDLAARMDPTKVRAKGFNTGKGARSDSGADNALWTETPEQKRKRLENEVLGISQPATSTTRAESTALDAKATRDNEEKARKIREYNDRHRSESLFTQHQNKTDEKKEKEDDASKRGWDYEKDMATGSKIGHAQRREMVKKAGDFGSKFSSGKYL